jgi:hypothetical protein
MPATNVRVEQGTQQFQGAFSNMWEVTGTMDFASASDGNSVSDTIAVPGVRLGDMVLGVSLGVDAAVGIITAYVSANNTVRVVVSNLETAALDLASTTVRVFVGRPAWQ